jgi:hypothetical protein
LSQSQRSRVVAQMAGVVLQGFASALFSQVGSLVMTPTAEVSDSLERVDSIINMLDEICDHMDGFSSAEEAWLSSITETLRTWRYVMQETYESAEDK